MREIAPLLHTESEIKRAICEFLEKFPDLVLFTVSPPRRGGYTSKFLQKGWPDIYGVIKHKGIVLVKPFFIEVKKPGGTLSVEQHKLLEKAKSLGAITCVAVCVDDVRQALLL